MCQDFTGIYFLLGALPALAGYTRACRISGKNLNLGRRLPAVKVAELAEDGELPVGCSVFELDDFLEVFPEVTVSLEGGHADNKPEDPPMEGCCGTFRYIIGPAPATVLMFK